LRFDPGAVHLSFAAVSTSLPTVTLIVPTRPGQVDVAAVTAGRALDYPSELVETIVARGQQPAVQRNAALQAARGEIIYFLDDDSIPPPQNLRRAVAHFARPEVHMVGGPNVCPADAPFLEQVFAVALSSWLAFLSSRARYSPVGRVRESGEKELILCNLLARRDAVLACGGFDEALYPNEENALMDALQQRGGKLIYDPGLVVYRRPRPTLKAFVKMLLNYGRGRAEQFRLHPTPGSALNFVPPLFCLYLVVGPWFGRLGLAPLVVYALAVLGQTVVSMMTKGIGKSILAMPLISLTHVFYGLGFWRGLFTSLKPAPAGARAGVSLEIVR
jgi:succinoglycan biosynthesis protein ExoA